LAGVVKDTFFQYVTLLLPGNGTNGAQNNTFLDGSTNNFSITRNGNTTQGTFSPFTASAPYSAATRGGSGYFDGTGDYLTVADNVALRPESGSFTLEFWWYPTTISGFITPYSKGYTAGGDLLLQTGSGDGKIIVYASGSAVITASTAVSTNAWNHIAVVRNGTSLVLYLNGTSVGSATNSTNFNSTQQAGIGATGTAPGGGSIGDFCVTGYMSNLRLVKGTAVYTAAFTPPTSPLTAITNTQLLLNFTNAGIIDNAMLNVLETVGNAQISTAQSKFGGSSMLFDETGDYLTVPVSTNMSLGTGDFTIECWVRFAVTPVGNGQGIYQLSNGYLNSQVRGPAAGANNADGRWAIYHGTSQTTHASLVPATNTWYHVAYVRSSGTSKLYIDGTEIISVADTTNYTDQYFVVGGWYSTGFLLNGYIDDLRITKGVARYTANFTPPAAAFPTS
jgi:hypothetical protein